MGKTNTSLDRQILFWSGLGPFILLLTFLVVFIKLSGSWSYVPAMGILGLPLCWFWRQSGLVATLLGIGITAALLYSNLPVDERFWLVGLSMATGLGLIVTTLAYEEVQGLIDAQQTQSRSRYENLLRLDEKLQSVQEEWRHDQENSQHDLAHLRSQILELEETVTTYEALLPKFEAEAAEADSRRDKLLEALWQNRQTRVATEQQLQEAQIEIKGLTDAYGMSQSDREKACHRKITDLEAVVIKSDEEFIRLQTELDGLSQSDQKQRDRVKELEAYLDDLQQQKRRLEAQCESAGDSLARYEQRLKSAEEQNQLVREQLEVARKEPEPVENRLQGRLDELSQSEKKLLNRLQELEASFEGLHREKEQAEARAQKAEALISAPAEEEAPPVPVENPLQAELDALGRSEKKLQIRVQELELALKERPETRDEKPVTPVPSQEGDENAALERRAKRWESMYKQLRDQFEEKTRVLSETRAELFHTENELLGLQREVDESNLSEGEEALQNHLKTVLNDLGELECQVQHTEDGYQDLVSGLLHELSELKANSAPSLASK